LDYSVCSITGRLSREASEAAIGTVCKAVALVSVRLKTSVAMTEVDPAASGTACGFDFVTTLLDMDLGSVKS